MAQRDPYSVLGVDRKATPGRDQEGLPQARAPVPPGPQPGRSQGRGALQGDPVGVRHRRRPGQAQAVRPRRDLLRLRRPARRRRRRRRRPGRLRRLRVRRVRRHPVEPVRRREQAAAPGRRARGGPRGERGADLEAEVSISFEQAIDGAQVPLSVMTSTACATCHGTGAKPGTSPKVCPRCQGRGLESQGQGLFSISQPCSALRRLRHVIEDPCPTCTATAPCARRSATA